MTPLDIMFDMSKLLGETIYYIRNRDSKPFAWEIIPIKVNEISRKLNRSGKDLGWAFIANGTRYKLTGLNEIWFLTENEAQRWIDTNRKKFENE